MSQVQHHYCVSRKELEVSGARVANMSVFAGLDRKCREVAVSGARVANMSVFAGLESRHRWDSNPQPSPRQGAALAIELRRQICEWSMRLDSNTEQQDGFEPPWAKPRVLQTRPFVLSGTVA